MNQIVDLQAQLPQPAIFYQRAGAALLSIYDGLRRNMAARNKA